MQVSYEQYKLLKIEKDQKGIATVTLNRPEMLNAFNPELHGELEYVWIDLARDKEIKAIILTGAGKAFSAGGDLKHMAQRAGTEAGLKHALGVRAGALRIFNHLLEVPQPIIAAVNGDAIGLGATIALFCDISIVAETARFGDTHTKVGLSAGDGGAVIWPLLVGPQRAKEYLMRGRLLTGKDAHSMNLVNYAAPVEEVLNKARAIAEELALQPIWAVQWTKLSVNKWLKNQVNLILDTSIALESLSMLTNDHAEAARAFVEKRKPQFRDF
jgi:enoyl-CoA hydratase